MKIIGLTGGIGSGKSTIAKVFESLGVPVYEADSRAKVLIAENREVKNRIIALFGDQAYTSANIYNRDFIASQVFGNPLLLKQLNEIVHPAVALDFEKWLPKSQGFVIKEAAIMNKNPGLNAIIVVISPEELRISRILKRDSFRNIEEIKRIITAQKTEEEFLEMADYVIYNNELELIIPQVLRIKSQIEAL